MRTLVSLALLLALPLAAQAPAKKPAKAEAPKPAAAAPAKPEAKKPEPKKAEAKKAEGACVGNQETKTCHRADCRMAAKMKADKKVSFTSKAEAEKQGYKPCKVCKP